MRVPVALDGTAFAGSASVGGLSLDLPGIAWAQSPPGSGYPSLPSFGPGSLSLAAGSPGSPLRRSVRWIAGERSIDLELSIGQEERGRGPGHVQSIGDQCLSVNWPVAPGQEGLLSAPGVDLVVWANARAHLPFQEAFVRSATELREAIGPSPVLWAPGIATPANLALLVLLGIDVVDTTEGYRRAAQGAWLHADLDDTSPPTAIECPCEGCLGRADTLEGRLQHAAHEYATELHRIRARIGRGRLREHLETRSVAHPSIGSMLRRFDAVAYDFQERHQAIADRGIRPYGIEASYRRVEMERFRRRFLTNYAPPNGKRLLLLVPCSYTKPYSNSPTHRSFARAAEAGADPVVIHWVSVTSPLGLVPQELENNYPARNYDIPVTGEWTESERAWVRAAVEHLVAHGSYSRVIAHLPRREYGWLSEGVPGASDWTWSAGDRSPSSKEALQGLERAVRGAEPGRGSLSRMRIEEARTTLSFQFSRDVAEALLAGDVRVRGPRWFLSLEEGGRDVLATWREDRGYWRLTSPGAAKAFRALGDWTVEVDPGVTLRGDVFAPGGIAAGAQVRVGSNVVLVQAGRPAGVGESAVPGRWVGRLRKGLIVRVRSRADSPANPDPELSPP